MCFFWYFLSYHSHGILKQGCYTILMFCQHLGVLEFAAFIVFPALLIVVLRVHKLPTWAGLDMAAAFSYP